MDCKSPKLFDQILTLVNNCFYNHDKALGNCFYSLQHTWLEHWRRRETTRICWSIWARARTKWDVKECWACIFHACTSCTKEARRFLKETDGLWCRQRRKKGKGGTDVVRERSQGKSKERGKISCWDQDWFGNYSRRGRGCSQEEKRDMVKTARADAAAVQKLKKAAAKKDTLPKVGTV